MEVETFVLVASGSLLVMGLIEVVIFFMVNKHKNRGKKDD